MGTWRCKQMEVEMSKPPSRSRDANVPSGKRTRSAGMEALSYLVG